MSVIRYIIHNSKELDFLDNIEKLPIETIHSVQKIFEIFTSSLTKDGVKNLKYETVSILIRNDIFDSWCYNCDNCGRKSECSMYKKDNIVVDVKQLLRERKLNRII